MPAALPRFSHFAGAALAITLAAIGAFAEQPKKPIVPTAPLPSQIVSAKRAFVSNAGQDNYAAGFVTILGAEPDRVYNRFYAALKEWGRYEIVSAPADADLVFEISFTLGDNGMKMPELGRLRLAIRDPRSNVLLWAFNRHLQAAILKGNRDKHLDQAVDAVVGSLKDLVK